MKRKILGWCQNRAAGEIAKSPKERMIRIVSIILAFMREVIIGYTPFHFCMTTELYRLKFLSLKL